MTAAFASAKEFLQFERVHDTSCLISDVHMPGLNGLELQRRLIEDGHCRPMIFITAIPEQEVRTRAPEAGSYGFLKKPFDIQHLIGCLDAAVKSAGRDR